MVHVNYSFLLEESSFIYKEQRTGLQGNASLLVNHPSLSRMRYSTEYGVGLR